MLCYDSLRAGLCSGQRGAFRLRWDWNWYCSAASAGSGDCDASAPAEQCPCLDWRALYRQRRKMGLDRRSLGTAETPGHGLGSAAYTAKRIEMGLATGTLALKHNNRSYPAGFWTLNSRNWFIRLRNSLPWQRRAKPSSVISYTKSLPVKGSLGR